MGKAIRPQRNTLTQVLGTQSLRRPLSGLLGALLALGCDRARDGEISTKPIPQENADLGSRLESVALADRWALDAQRASDPRRAHALYERAAILRERLFRRERRMVDGLEALELWGAVAREPSARCSAELRMALLEGELRRDPRRTYERLYAAKLGAPDAACQSRVDRALLALVAHRPPEGVLEAIERRNQRSDAAPRIPMQPHSSARAPSDDEPARVERVERYGAEDAARIVIFVNRPVRFESGSVEGPKGEPRVSVDVPGVTHTGMASYDVGGLVEKVRLGPHERGTRILLELRTAAEARVFYLPEPFRLVIDVMAEQKTETGRHHGAGEVHAPRAVRRVVLDPGHGGHDPGATGPNGLREKDVTLDIAHRAAPILAHELGITTLLTRDGDDYVPLDERSARANAFHADLFVSIHCNASEDGVAKGVTTFVLDRAREDVALRLAARENASSESAASELANALGASADPSHREASLRLADLLQRAALASLEKNYPDIPSGGVQRAGFYVLAGARMPAVLFEASFISNASGANLLNSADFRQKMADAVVNAVRAYRDGH